MDGPGAAAHDCTNYEAHQCYHKTVAAYYELLELPQAIFYVMLLNEAEKFRVLHGPRLRSLEVALTELRWRAFESWIWLFGDRVYEARFRLSSLGEGAWTGRQGEASSGGAVDKGAFRDPVVIMAFLPTHSTKEMANYVREVFTWCRRSARPLPGDFEVLCPHFSLGEAEAAAMESGLPEIVQAMFYAMLLNDVLELGAVHEYTAEKMRSVLMDLGWSDFEAWMCIMDQ
ncbi:hypothetical protein Cgig2_005307 [Carnegiea gigantea]|uniref:Uncharacterized protein n=1 Tax=Carnegiea gigantea TaxID=171969 RepID=A0A9Q1QBX6_9CARY|nr:hypothetical protein Cgig2_005307 [Carnegiea gigantea]